MNPSRTSHGRVSGLVEPALSASRAKEYERCPLQYRLHVVDRISEPATRATALGTLVHSVLENLFDLSASDRTVEAAVDLMDTLWASTVDQTPQVLALFEDDADRQQWLESARTVVRAYFAVEDPQWLQPAAREQLVEAVSADGIRLRGFIDRIDRAPSGALRVVDYKTGRAPSLRFQDEALFQMRFYALLLSLSSQMPARTQLLYLKSGQVLTFDPTVQDVQRFSHRLADVWGRIEADAHRGEFAPRRNPLCNWCGVRAMCPLFEGNTPELPEGGVARLLRTRVSGAA